MQDEVYKGHWDNIYAAKEENEVSWFQPYPKISLDLIESLHLPKDANIIDIGGGNSHLVDELLHAGYENIWVLDISSAGIEKAKQRLGRKANSVHWIVSDILDFIPVVKFDLWHDRAAFHFLITEKGIDKYVSIAENTVNQNGYLVLGTFSEQGPKKCSGLNIKQYSETSMTARFAASFEKLRCIYQDHTTPFNTLQNFLYCIFKRK